MNVITLLPADEIATAVHKLGHELTHLYRGKPLTVLGVMSGSFVFLADLVRHINLPLRVGVVQARSYRGAATSPGDLSINLDFLPELTDRHVLLVDDIFDTGKTLEGLLGKLSTLRPASLETAVLLRKADRAQCDWVPRHVLFEIPDVFVVGYGLDFQDAYRNLPFVAALEPHEIAGTAG